jgi:uncharacterized protein (DUF1800 family)
VDRVVAALALAALLTLGACASPTSGTRAAAEPAQRIESAADRLGVVNRLTWGANASSVRRIEATGLERYIEEQLSPASAALPPEVQAQIDSMTISQRAFDDLVFEVESKRRAFLAIREPQERNAARRVYLQELARLSREAQTRAVLRAIYSPNQLQEQMTWFWMNHFNVYQFKFNVRALLPDFEESAIRPHALGRFRALLGAVARHPAMLRYLDNDRNGANRINENYARELMELHTMGATGGYTQKDVQELARVLTGVGMNVTPATPNVRPERRGDYVRRGIFEFNPNRHDYREKVLLGERMKSSGPAELDEALDRLARHPSTARFVSRKLAVFLVADDPPRELVERMARVFQSSDGDIAAVLRVMIASPEFAASLGRKFKDPVHYVISAVRLAYDEKPILNAGPVLGWLNRMGEGLYRRETPDGYPLTQSGWASPGQMTTRFEIARAIAAGAPALFTPEGRQDVAVDALPRLSGMPYVEGVQKTLGAGTVNALERARTPHEWNTFLLSSPEFMNR